MKRESRILELGNRIVLLIVSCVPVGEGRILFVACVDQRERRRGSTLPGQLLDVQLRVVRETIRVGG